VFLILLLKNYIKFIILTLQNGTVYYSVNTYDSVITFLDRSYD